MFVMNDILSIIQLLQGVSHLAVRYFNAVSLFLVKYAEKYINYVSNLRYTHSYICIAKGNSILST